MNKPAGIFLFLITGLLLMSLACQRNAPAETPTVSAIQTSGPVVDKTPVKETAIVDIRGGIYIQSETVVPIRVSPQATQVVEHQPEAPRTQYRIEAHLSADLHKLEADEAIIVSNQSGIPLNELILVVEANREAGVFSLLQAKWQDGISIIDNIKGTTWKVSIPGGLAPGAKVTLEIAYRLDLPGRGSVLGVSARQVNFGDWYPRVAYFSSETGWLIHEAANVGENSIYDMADYSIRLDLSQAPENLILAASALAVPCDKSWCYAIENSRGFAWSASSEYQVLEAYEGGVQLRQYVFPEHLRSGQAAMDAARKAIKTFQEHFGTYPYPSLAMVEGAFFDGMEYPGLFFLGEEYYTSYAGSLDSYLITLTVHELAHQWWYAQVGNDQALEPWLDESLATYSELLFYQENYPELIDWWWDFRVRRFDPGGFVNSTVYDYPEFRLYVNAVYLRGAQFVQELRRVMGDQAFYEFVATYIDRFHWRVATGEDFFKLAEQYADREAIQQVKAGYFQP